MLAGIFNYLEHLPIFLIAVEICQRTIQPAVALLL
jgi:hypothetical protein